LKLFSVDHEDWEDVDTRNTTPPDGALAFEMETAAWISTEEALDSVPSSAKLRYTQHGLDLLRKEGYEGG